MLRTSPKAGADPQADAQLFLHAPQQVFQSSRLRRASRRAAALLFLAGQEEDATVRAGASVRSRSQTQAPGGQGWRRGGEALMAPS